MEKPATEPTKLTDFRGQPPRVTPTQQPKDPGDLEATRSLILTYSKHDGFHCPVCGVVIKDPNQAVIHLGEEINKAMEKISGLSKH